MPIALRTSPSRVLRDIAGRIPRALRQEFRREEPAMDKEIFRFLSKKTLRLFDLGRDPRGRFWARLSGRSLAIRRFKGHRGKKPGVGKKKALRNSFKLGNAHNVARRKGSQLIFASKLRRGGVNVARAFEETYTFPKTEEGRRKMAGFIYRATGDYAPRTVNGWKHRGRRILEMTPGYKREIRKIVEQRGLKAARRAYRDIIRSTKS